jgi:hypothetical protein
MPLPATVCVKISDEAGGSISFSPVVVKHMAVCELVEIALISAGGKSPDRIAEHLYRGSLVSGASRFRWEGFQIDPAALGAILAGFPDPDPSICFNPKLCRAVIVRTKSVTFHPPPDTVTRRRILRSRSFLDALVEIADAVGLAYGGYSYRDRADIFTLTPDAGTRQSILAAVPLIAHASLRARLSAEPIEAVEFHAARGRVGD